MEELQNKIDQLHADLDSNDELMEGLLADSKAKQAEVRKLEKLKLQLGEVLGVVETSVSV